MCCYCRVHDDLSTAVAFMGPCHFDTRVCTDLVSMSDMYLSLTPLSERKHERLLCWFCLLRIAQHKN